MNIKFSTIKQIYLFLAVFYYCGFLNFFSRLAAGGRGSDLMAENASGSLYKQIIGLILLLLGTYIISKNNHKVVIKYFRSCWPLLLLITYFAVSIYWSPEKNISIRRIIAFITAILCCFCLVLSFTPKSLLRYIAYAGVTAALLGLLIALINPGMAFGGEGERAYTFRGIFFDKNGGARFYAYSLIILYALGFKLHLKWLLPSGVLGLCILMANSVSAVILTIIGISLVILFNRLHSNSANLNLRRVFLALIIIGMSAVIINFAYNFILELFGRDPNLTNRALIWALLDEYIQEKPVLGFGFGAFWASSAVEGFVERWGFIGNAHSGYYETILNGGLVGLSLLFILLFKTISDLLKNYVYSSKDELIALCLSITLIQIIANYVGFVILNHNSLDMFLLSIVIFISSQYKLNNRKKIDTK